MLQGACRNDDRYVGGTMYFEDAGALIDGCAGGHHVIDQQYLSPAQVSATFKCPPDILVAFFRWQIGLPWGWPVTPYAAAVDGQIEVISDDPGNFHRLVEAAFAQAVRVQGQRDDELMLSRDPLGQSAAQPVGDGQLMAVLERVNDAVNREIITKSGNRPVEVRRLLQAGATTLAVGRLNPALRATGRWRCWEIGRAIRAEQATLAIVSAEQAAFRE